MRKNYSLLWGGLLMCHLPPTFAMFVGAYNDNIERFYGRLDGGYNIYTAPSATTFSSITPSTQIWGTQESVSNNFGVNAGVGYKISATTRTDVTLTYRPSMSFQLLDNAPQLASSTMNNYTFMLNGYYDFQLNLPVTAYGMVGIGVSSNTTKNLLWPVSGVTEIGTTTSHFAWQVGPGVAYQLSNNVWADFNYQFIELGPFSNGGFYSSSLGQYQPTSWSTLYDNQLQIGIRAYI